MPKKSKEHIEEPMYILYNSEDGRILGQYSKYDAERGRRIPCEPGDVIEAMIESSTDLIEGRFEILEVQYEENRELKRYIVDVKTKTLVVQKLKAKMTELSLS